MATARTRGSSTVLGSTSTTTPPTMPLSDAIAEYQKANQASVDAFGGIVPWLTSRGYSVAYATHGPNGSLRSNDAIVDSSGRVYDLLVNSDGPSPTWYFGDKGTYDATRPVMTPGGTSMSYAEWQKSVGGTTSPTTGTRGAPPPHGTNPNDRPSTGTAVPRGSQATNAYADARLAQSRIRQQARGQGRSSTILGGFQVGTPLTRPATLLGA